MNKNKIIITDDYYSETLIIENQVIEDLQLSCCEFEEAVFISNCKILDACFFAAYFAKNLLIQNSEFLSKVDFSCGDTINNYGIFRIENVIFNEFVDFQDFAFRGKTKLENVNFRKGTNLFGNIGTPVQVSFESMPLLINVLGELNINDFK